MLNHQMARARVADHTARGERLATHRQLLASRQAEKQASGQRWRIRSRFSAHYTKQAPLQA